MIITIIYGSLVLDLLCVIYFQTSVTMPDPQTSDKSSDTVNDVSASSGISSPWKAANSMSKRSRWKFM